jgi:hypothetical protein
MKTLIPASSSICNVVDSWSRAYSGKGGIDHVKALPETPGMITSLRHAIDAAEGKAGSSVSARIERDSKIPGSFLDKVLFPSSGPMRR